MNKNIFLFAGAAPGGAWVPHAAAAGLPAHPVRHHARVLAQGEQASTIQEIGFQLGQLLYLCLEKQWGGV